MVLFAVHPVKMSTSSDDKLCLQWNDFSVNLRSAFGDLRDDNEFTDVTLVCEDGQQVGAHKVVLVSSSPFFLNLFKRNKHSHPLVYMRGLTFENLLSVVDFLYKGEANVFQENLDSFLVIAEELQLKGLDRKDKEADSMKVSQMPTSTTSETTLQVLNNEAISSPMTETDIALTNFSSSIDLDELDAKVKSMMIISENRIGKQNIKARVCMICGKAGQMNVIMHHIEANHISDISIHCSACNKTLNTRHALDSHKRKYHSTKYKLYSL